MQQEFEYIYEIYRSGSFSKAAENLYVTQPALSMSVKKVEASIGMSLFDRSTRPIELTEAGKIYIASIEKILAVEEDMHNMIRDIDELIGKFEHYPAFHDHILLAVSPETLSLPCALSAKDVKEGRHLRPECPAISGEYMKGLEYIILSEGNNLHDRAVSIFSEMKITPRIKLEISQLATSYHLTESNFGAAFISDRMISDEENNLNFYRIDSPLTERLFYTIMPRREYTSRSVRAFIDLFCSLLS